MAADELQIALEHHRAGRLVRAAEGYQAILNRDPQDAEACLWMGMLACQAGRPDDAVVLLKRAAIARPDDAAVWHNLGMAYLAGRKTELAISGFERAIAIEPGRGEALLGLGLARLSRKLPDENTRAVDALKGAIAAGVDSADAYYHLAAALYECERLGEAIEACGAVVRRDAEYAQAFYLSALASRRLGYNGEARKGFLKAVEIDPSMVRAWCGLASLDADTGNLDIAAGILRKAIKLRPDYAPAYDGLGKVLRAVGCEAEAMAAFAQAVRTSRQARSQAAVDGARSTLASAVQVLEERLGDAKTGELHYALASQSEIFAPAIIPASLVAKLFDRYADHFEEHLSVQLQYQVPEMIAERIARLRPAGGLNVLDLGCGTGKCGALLKPFAKTLDGVDLSAAMVEKTRQRGQYDRVEVGDLVEALAANPAEFDLIVAADVFVYIGELQSAFEESADALRPDGLFVFSVESAEGDRFVFQKKSRRFAHSRKYLQRLAEINGFAEVSFEEIVVRTDAGEAVEGYLVILRLLPR